MERAAFRLGFVLPIFFTLLSATFAGPINVSDMVGGLDSVEQILDPEELSSYTTPPPSHSYDEWEDWETWEPSPELVKWFPYYRSGYDENGLILYIMEFGKWNYRELAHQPEETIQEFWKYYEQYIRRIERDAALNNHQGTAFILDWEGFGLGGYASPKALQLALKMLTNMVRVNQALVYGFYINVNFSAETFINTARPFLGTLLSKFEIYGTHSNKWKAWLLRKVPANQLPPKYGGEESWKPLPLNP